MAARMPMMATTISSSIRVKPDWPERICIDFMLDSCSVENSRHHGGVGLYARSVPTSRYLHAQAGYRRLRKKL
jgi:hypothetical protein